jgi:hypothetical protein
MRDVRLLVFIIFLLIEAANVEVPVKSLKVVTS